MALLVTWNMQGATGFGGSKWRQDVSRLFLQQGVEIACLQECGMPPASAVPMLGVALAPPPPFVYAAFTWNLGSTRRAFNVTGFWMQTDPGANRNNLAVVTTLPPINMVYLPGTAWGRPTIGITFANPAGGAITFYTLHANSPGGADAPTLLANIIGAGGTWFAAGDYNRNPTSWAGVAPGGANLCGHSGITHPGSGTLLDYAFCSGAAVAGQVDQEFVVSDHYPVFYDV